MKSIDTYRLIALISLILGLLLPSAAWAQGPYAYVTGSSDSYIRVVYLPTQAYAGSVYAGQYPASAALSRDGKTMWLQASGQFSVVRVPGGPVLYGSPYFSYGFSKPAFSPDGSRAYYLRTSYGPSGNIVNLLSYDTSGYARIDSFALSGVYSWTADPAISKDGNKVYVADYNYRLLEVDPFSGTIGRTLSVSSYIYRMIFSPDGSSLYLVHYSSVDVVNLSTFRISKTYSFNYSLSTIVPSRDGATLYVFYSSMSMFTMFNLASSSGTDYSIWSYAADAAVDPTDSLLYIVHNSYSSNVSIFNLNTKSTSKLMSVSTYPTSIAMPLPEDNVPPDPVGSIQAIALSYNTARLIVTAPGDDGSTGTASFYLVRYDTIPITDGNFSQATRFLRPPAPKPAGSVDTIDVTGLKGGTRYYFGIKAGDEVLNLSTLVTDSLVLPPPPRIALEVDSSARTIADNDSVALSFVIRNTGGSDLVFKASGNALAEVGGTSGEAFLAEPRSIQSTEKVGAAGPKVLLLFGDHPVPALDVKAKLLASGTFALVDTMNATVRTPTLADLNKYDAVLVWSDMYAGSFYFADPAGLGNALADYVDNGGGVVTAVYAMATDYYQCKVTGRFDSDDYWVIEPGTSNNGSHDALVLGSVEVPNHPIMRGVSSFIGNHSMRIVNGSIASNATLVASWSDGSPLVAVRTVNGVRRVDLGFMPPSSDVYSGEFWQSSSDGGLLLANSLAYVAGRAGNITATFLPDSGIVGSQSQQTVQLNLVTKNAKAGSYRMTVNVESNDPDNPSMTFRIPLTIRDLTPPHLAIRFFQNEAFSDYLSVIFVARESLYTPSLALVFGTDTTHPALRTIDTLNHVYTCDYKFVTAGTLTVLWSADDSVGNRATATRQLSAQGIAPQAGGSIASVDMRAELSIPPNALARASYLTAEQATEPATVGAGQPIGSTYRFAPALMELKQPARLRFRYEDRPGLQPGHMGIFEHTPDGRWICLATRIDARTKTLYADIQHLGEYQVVDDPAIQSLPAEEMPDRYELSQNYPNPFNPTTLIRFGLPAASVVDLKIYDVLGREVRTLLHEYQGEGYHEATWDGTTTEGTAAASGVYYYRLNAGTFSAVKTMMLVR